jgi:hypothetical protein
MSPDSLPSNSPFDGERSSEVALADALGSVRALAAGRFTVYGPVGRDPEGTFAFLARELSADRLVVLKAASASNDVAAPSVLKVIPHLDASVPPPAGACAVCQTPIVGWDPPARSAALTSRAPMHLQTKGSPPTSSCLLSGRPPMDMRYSER